MHFVCLLFIFLSRLTSMPWSLTDLQTSTAHLFIYFIYLLQQRSNLNFTHVLYLAQLFCFFWAFYAFIWIGQLKLCKEARRKKFWEMASGQTWTCVPSGNVAHKWGTLSACATVPKNSCLTPKNSNKMLHHFPKMACVCICLDPWNVLDIFFTP